MSDTYIIEKRGDLVLSWLLGADGRAVSIRADREESGPQTGEIYAGRVQRVRADLKAAFVDIGPGITGYLPFEESEDAVFIRKGGGKGLAQGDELLVQVSSEAQKTKDARLTARLSLQGMYSVVSLADGSAGVSKRLPEEERERLRALAERIRQDARYGLILRTNAALRWQKRSGRSGSASKRSKRRGSTGRRDRESTARGLPGRNAFSRWIYSRRERSSRTGKSCTKAPAVILKNAAPRSKSESPSMRIR